MVHRTTSRPLPLHLLLAGVLFQGLSGVVGGGALLLDPSGDLLQMPLGLLVGSPFADYRIPGLLLFLVLGVAPLAVAAGLWGGRPWAWKGAVAVGVGLIVWIGVQIFMIGYYPRPPLQLVYGLLGVAILGLALAPSVRRVLVGR